MLFPLRDAEHLGDGEGLLLGPGHAAAGGGQPRGEGEGGTARPPRASLPSCPQGCAGVLGGGLCSGVTLPLPPELHQDLSASLLLAGHHGQRGRGHLEAGRRHRPAQGAQVRPDGRWGQGEGGLGVRRGPPPKLCRFPPLPTQLLAQGRAQRGAAGELRRGARGRHLVRLPLHQSAPLGVRGAALSVQGGGHLEGPCPPPHKSPSLPQSPSPRLPCSPAAPPLAASAPSTAPSGRDSVLGAHRGGPRGIINGCTE